MTSFAYRRGQRAALEKYATAIAGLVPPAMPKAVAPVSSVVQQKPPAPVGAGGNAGSGAPVAPLGMTAATSTSTAPALGLQSSPVLETGIKPPTSAPAVAGQTALQGAAQSVSTHGSGK